MAKSSSGAGVGDKVPSVAVGQDNPPVEKKQEGGQKAAAKRVRIFNASKDAAKYTDEQFQEMITFRSLSPALRKKKKQWDRAKAKAAKIAVEYAALELAERNAGNDAASGEVKSKPQSE